MVKLLLAMLIIGISAYCIYKDTIVFVAMYGFFADPYAAQGITGYLCGGFPYYSVIMDSMLLGATVFTILQLTKDKNRTRKEYGLLGACHISFIAVSVIISYAINRVEILSNFAWPFSNFVPLSLFLLIGYDKRQRAKQVFDKYLKFSILLSALIVYLPTVGIDFLSQLSGANYVSDGFAYNNNVAGLNNFYEAFIRKYYFNGLGQFHNGNGMGFFGGVGIFWSAYRYQKESGIWKKITEVAFFDMSVLLWCNGSARAGILGIVLGIGLFVIYGKAKIKIKALSLMTLLIGLTVALCNNKLLSFMFVDSGNISVTSRTILRRNAISYLQDNWLMGNGGLLGDLTRAGVDPHELPLRIACLFGVVPSLLTILMIYVIPGKHIVNGTNRSLLSFVFFSIFSLITLTNNFTCIILSSFILYIAMLEVKLVNADTA